jgi:peptidoglycan hydrolase-like protein with peptidoglycan-binding domain
MTETPFPMKTRFSLVVALALTAGLGACASSQPAAPAMAPAPAPMAAPAPAPMMPTTPKEKTMALQTALNNNGATLTVDGVYGKKTASAVSGYQKSKGMKPTGRADAKTLGALGL